MSSTSTNPVQNKVVQAALDNKVDKETGKGLSTNDFTTILKTKLDSIAEGANKITVDATMSSTSTNPVQNKVVQSALDNNVNSIAEYINGVFGRFTLSTQTVTAATTANITLKALQTIDGVSLAVNNVVLVKNQTEAKNNGLYAVSTTNWERLSGFTTESALKEKIFKISNGTTNKNKLFYITNKTFTVGTDAIEIAEYKRLVSEQLADSLNINDTLNATTGNITTLTATNATMSGTTKTATLNVTGNATVSGALTSGGITVMKATQGYYYSAGNSTSSTTYALLASVSVSSTENNDISSRFTLLVSTISNTNKKIDIWINARWSSGTLIFCTLKIERIDGITNVEDMINHIHLRYTYTAKATMQVWLYIDTAILDSIWGSVTLIGREGSVVDCGRYIANDGSNWTYYKTSSAVTSMNGASEATKVYQTTRLGDVTTSALTATGATTLNSTLGVTGATTLKSTLGVTGATTLSGGCTVKGGLSVTGTLNASLDWDKISNKPACITGSLDSTGTTLTITLN